MVRSPTSGSSPLSAKTQDGVTALVGFLSLAEVPYFTAEQRVQFAAAASGQARALREQFQGRLLIIVDQQQTRQYERLKRTFAEDGQVEIVLDRRRGARRRASAARPRDRRQWDRRQRTIEEDLARLGMVLVPVVAPIVAVGNDHATPPLAFGNGHATPAQTGQGYRVLVIDDDPAIVQLLSSYFEIDKEGYLVDTATSGEKGLASLRAHRPDVVLLDINMPGMNGLEVLKRIRSIDAGIPVIMVSAAPYQATTAALEGGAFAHVPKPFDFRDIDHLVTLATAQGGPRDDRR